MKVRLMIESTWHGPAKRDGVAMWLMEYMKGDIPITRQGYVHVKDGTEAAVLKRREKDIRTKDFGSFHA